MVEHQFSYPNPFTDRVRVWMLQYTQVPRGLLLSWRAVGKHNLRITEKKHDLNVEIDRKILAVAA